MISHEFDPVVVKVLSNTPFTMHKYPRCVKCKKIHQTQQPHVLKWESKTHNRYFFCVNLGHLLARAYINQDAITLQTSYHSAWD